SALFRIRGGDVYVLAIAGGAPLDASQRPRRTHLRIPHDRAVARIQCPVDSALLAETDDVAQQVRSGAAHVVIWPLRIGTLYPWLGMNAGLRPYVIGVKVFTPL